MNFEELIISLSRVNHDLREQSISAVNMSLTLRNWYFGYYIFEFEQNGKDRAEYGKGLLAFFAKEMRGQNIANCDERELRRCRQFYLTYPFMAKVIVSDSQTRALLPSISVAQHIEITSNQIRGSLSPEFNILDSLYVHRFNNENLMIVRSNTQDLTTAN